MNIKLFVVGKTSKGFVLDGVSEYVNRLKHYVNFQINVIAEIKNTKNLSPVQIKELEAQQILKNVSSEDKIILLDEHGKEFSSKGFADYLQMQMNAGLKNIVFVVGGAYGFDEKLKTNNKEKISISKMTFSHQMIRLLFVEQLYRAFTILKNEPYHNE